MTAFGIGISPVFTSHRPITPLPAGITPVLYLQNNIGLYENTLGTDPCEDDDNIAHWADQSGSGNNATQATAGDYPAYRAAEIAGSRPVADFDIAADTHLDLDSAIALSAFHIFVVVRYNTLTAGDYLIFAGGSAGPPKPWIGIRGSNQANTLDDAGNNGTINGLSLSTDTWYLLEYRFDGTTLTAYVNGTAINSHTTHSGESFTIDIAGNNGAFDAVHEGDLAELLIYDAAASSPNAAQVRANLNQRLLIY